MRSYALRLGFNPDAIGAHSLRAPAPDGATPWDALWHALQLGAPHPNPNPNSNPNPNPDPDPNPNPNPDLPPQKSPSCLLCRACGGRAS